ncbi:MULTISPECIES: hypothetical protein [Sulfurisphaera]|uniref:Transposase n=1 Tax=Sulfurisphaera ohwakuensis TaxID=69656 RepID=A0A7J9RTA5_SULOH|nr:MULTISPECIES: hypothetical protein [Sulfurisphaera]MBB5253756.1 hypothetical protein [Sulfurisphaera ohwakuensis]
MGYKSRLYHLGKWNFLRYRYNLIISKKLALKIARKRWKERYL